MIQLISFNKATRIAQFLFGLFMLFHFVIILGILFLNLPLVDYLWGGKLKTNQELLQFEIISVLTLVFCYCVVLIKANKIYLPKLKGIVNFILWILSALFLLNTIGNFIAKTIFEKCFAIITLILCLLCIRLALEKQTTINIKS